MLRKLFKSFGSGTAPVPNKLVDDVLVPENLDDVFDLEAFTLENGLEVCLYSWKSKLHLEQPCTLSLSVKAGACNDFDYCPGVAHLLEHVLFHSSELYPGPFAFPKIIHEMDGAYNAFTEDWETVYHFQTASSDFVRAFSAFSQMFISPLFDPNYIYAEAHVVDNEFARSVHSKTFRDIFAYKILHPEGNPRRRIACGNLDTFLNLCQNESRRELASVVQDFFDIYYVPSNMKLAVFAGELDKVQMKTILTEAMGKIPRRRTWRTVEQLDPTVEQTSETPFDEKFKGKLVFVEPRAPTQTVKLMWKVSSYKNFYKSMPFSYVSMLLLSRSKDSLLHVLQEKRWASAVNACQYFDTYEIEIFCTDAGIAEYRTIIHLVHVYLGMIKQTILGKFEKATKILAAWLPSLPTNPAALCNYTVMQMLNYEREHWLIGGNEVIEGDPEFVAEYLSKLSVRDCVTVVVSEESSRHCNTYVPEFSLHYGVEEIAVEIPESFGTLALSNSSQRRYGYILEPSHKVTMSPWPCLRFHTKLHESLTSNETLALVCSQVAVRYFNPDLSLQFLDELREDGEKGELLLAALLGRMVVLASRKLQVCNVSKVNWLPPRLAYSSSQMLLWHKCDLTSDYILSLRVTSDNYKQSAPSQAAIHIMVLMVKAHLTRRYALPEDQVVVTSGKFGGVLIAIRSDSEAVISTRLQLVANAFKEISERGNSFQRAKQIFVEKNCNVDRKKPMRLSQENVTALLNFDTYTNEDLKRAGLKLSFRHIESLAATFGSEDFFHVFYSGRTPSFHRVIMKAFNVREEKEAHPCLEGDQIVSVPRFSQNYYMVQSSNKEDITSGVTICYQLDDLSCKTEALLRLYVKCIAYKAHRYFRSEEKVTYHIELEGFNLNGIPTLWFSCESSGCDPMEVDTKLERFFYKSSPELSDLSADFQLKYKRNAVRELLGVSNGQMECKSARDAFWSKQCVQECTYDFLRNQLICYHILTATSHDLVSFYKTYFAPFSKLRRKVVSGVFTWDHTKNKLGESPHLATLPREQAISNSRSKSLVFGKCKELMPVYDSLGKVNQISNVYDFKDGLSPMQTEPELTAQTGRLTLGYIDMVEFRSTSSEEEKKEETLTIPRA